MALKDFFKPAKIRFRPRSMEQIIEDTEIEKLRKQVSALESFLDTGGGDPDYRLPGYDNQSLYRQMSGHDTTDTSTESLRDVPASKRSEILRMSHVTYGYRGDAHNLIEIVVDFVIGDDLIPQAKDPENKKLQDAVDEIWTDPKNDLSTEAEEYIRGILMDGELFIIAEMVETSGDLRLSWMPPEQVIQVKQDDRRFDNFCIVRSPDAERDDLTYLVLNQFDEETKITYMGETENARYRVSHTSLDGHGNEVERSKSVHGLVFAYYNLRPKGAFRGRPWLQEVLDYIDLHDELIWSQVEREKILKMFIVDVLIKDGKDKASIDRRLADMGLAGGAPQDPVVIGHNDKVEFKLHSPETSGRPTQHLEQVLRENTYGAKGLPSHWSGGGGGSNFATARAQDVVPMRRLRRKQRQFITMFLNIMQVSLQLKMQKGSLPESLDTAFDMSYLEVGGRDRQRGSAIMKDLSLAVTKLVDGGLISREAGHAISMQASGEAGFALDKEEERKMPPKPAPKPMPGGGRLAQSEGASKQKSSRGPNEGDEAPDDRTERRGVADRGA